MLVHEFIHAEQRHLDIRAANSPKEMILELEKDADNGAFEALVDPMLGDTEKLSRGWAILAALLSSCLVNGESTATQLTTHLPLHHRLEHMLRGVKVSSAENQVDAVPALILRRCARKKGLANFVDWCNMTKHLSSRLFGASSPGAQV